MFKHILVKKNTQGTWCVYDKVEHHKDYTLIAEAVHATEAQEMAIRLSDRWEMVNQGEAYITIDARG